MLKKFINSLSLCREGAMVEASPESNVRKFCLLVALYTLYDVGKYAEFSNQLILSFIKYNSILRRAYPERRALPPDDELKEVNFYVPEVFDDIKDLESLGFIGRKEVLTARYSRVQMITLTEEGRKVAEELSRDGIYRKVMEEGRHALNKVPFKEGYTAALIKMLRKWSNIFYSEEECEIYHMSDLCNSNSHDTIEFSINISQGIGPLSTRFGLDAHFPISNYIKDIINKCKQPLRAPSNKKQTEFFKECSLIERDKPMFRRTPIELCGLCSKIEFKENNLVVIHLLLEKQIILVEVFTNMGKCYINQSPTYINHSLRVVGIPYMEEKIMKVIAFQIFDRGCGIITNATEFSENVAKHHATQEVQGCSTSQIPKMSKSLSMIIEYYNQLIHKEKITEEEILKFLLDHPLILSQDVEQILYKPNLSEEHIPDFMIKASNRKFLLVEIEHPQARLFTKQMDETKELRKARTQMERYLSFIRNNILYLREKYPDLSVENLQGLIVIGLDSTLTKEEKQRLNQLNYTLKDYQIKTFDELARALTTFLENLREQYDGFF
jgi:DNA-binding MarR family transcriptional regulator